MYILWCHFFPFVQELPPGWPQGLPPKRTDNGDGDDKVGRSKLIHISNLIFKDLINELMRGKDGKRLGCHAVADPGLWCSRHRRRLGCPGGLGCAGGSWCGSPALWGPQRLKDPRAAPGHLGLGGSIVRHGVHILGSNTLSLLLVPCRWDGIVPGLQPTGPLVC